VAEIKGTGNNDTVWYSNEAAPDRAGHPCQSARFSEQGWRFYRSTLHDSWTSHLLAGLYPQAGVTFAVCAWG